MDKEVTGSEELKGLANKVTLLTTKSQIPDIQIQVKLVSFLPHKK